MKIDLTGIVIVVGNYGSGKTEVSINLAVERKRAGVDVRMADLDLVNPYFRTREAEALMAKLGIHLVIPDKQYLQADLPILSPAVAGLIRSAGEMTILDVGGDDAGATVLASLADILANRSAHVLQVVNPFRPYTDSVEGCLTIRKEIEVAANLKITGLVGNANLIEDTTIGHIRDGYELVEALSKQSGLPLKFITAPKDLVGEIDEDEVNCPILPIHRQLVPPWRKVQEIKRNT